MKFEITMKKQEMLTVRNFFLPERQLGQTSRPLVEYGQPRPK
jgi:hypothetical protein